MHHFQADQNLDGSANKSHFKELAVSHIVFQSIDFKLGIKTGYPGILVHRVFLYTQKSDGKR